MSSTTLKVMDCKYIPEILEDGVLYISEKFHVAIHKCPCGCSMEVVTPFGACSYSWKLTKSYKGVSLEPSLLNRSCGSHYFITDNKVCWC